MRLDRGEAGGIGTALLLHVGLVVALTTSLAGVPPKPEAPAMDVELVVDSEEVALTAVAGSAAAPSGEQGAEPAPSVRPVALPGDDLPPAPLEPASAADRARTSRLDDDFLKGISSDSPPSARPAAQSAATFGAAARASVDQAIKRQIQPCADRQPALGAGAEQIRLKINLRLSPDGRLKSLSVLGVSGNEGDSGRFVPLVEDQAQRVFAECSPLRLPAELYSTPQGGWGNINMTYRVQ